MQLPAGIIEQWVLRCLNVHELGTCRLLNKPLSKVLDSDVAWHASITQMLSGFEVSPALCQSAHRLHFLVLLAALRRARALLANNLTVELKDIGMARRVAALADGVASITKARNRGQAVCSVIGLLRFDSTEGVAQQLDFSHWNARGRSNDTPLQSEPLVVPIDNTLSTALETNGNTLHFKFAFIRGLLCGRVWDPSGSAANGSLVMVAISTREHAVIIKRRRVVMCLNTQTWQPVGVPVLLKGDEVAVKALTSQGVLCALSVMINQPTNAGPFPDCLHANQLVNALQIELWHANRQV